MRNRPGISANCKEDAISRGERSETGKAQFQQSLRPVRSLYPGVRVKIEAKYIELD